jgi:ribosomal protein S18 acetylase RimI-like enzyme
MRIRHAIADDATALSALAERAFRNAFAADNSPEDVDAYVREAFSVERVRNELANAGNMFLLACTTAGDLAGYAKLHSGTADDSISGPHPIEIARLYADPDRIGRGIGAALMRACLDEAAARGYRTIWLGVWVRNARAISFYERWRFHTVGSHPFMLGSDEQTDLIMERPVDLRL